MNIMTNKKDLKLEKWIIAKLNLFEMNLHNFATSRFCGIYCSVYLKQSIKHNYNVSKPIKKERLVFQGSI